MADRPVVTRFAPSPTGFMHVGGVRTALFAWLFARKHGGTFILRIEDTDKEREVEGSTEHIIESLKWLGITWDEGPDIQGPNGPYIQSQRLETYRQYAHKLIEKGLAYPDPYTEEELAAFRKQAEEEKRPFLFREHRPQTTERWDGSKPLRFKVPEIKRTVWHDLVRGELSAGEEALDDFILLKADGYPTYNFAHIVDDAEMGVTHVIRGEEFISSTPKFLSLYEALELTPPIFATMPVILGPDGKKKLSKRDGAKDILDYRTEGYLPEALVNFLALLGWHPDGEREVMSVAELIESFDLKDVQKGGAAFDETKLRWFNREHLKKLPPEEFSLRLAAFMKEQGMELPPYLSLATPILMERAETLAQAAQMLQTECGFFEESISYPSELLLNGGKIAPQDAAAHLEAVETMLAKLPEDAWDAERIKNEVFPYANEHGRAMVLWPMRAALTGRERSPDPFIVASLIGKEKTLARLQEAARILKK